MVYIDNPTRLTAKELETLHSVISKANFALYHCATEVTPESLLAMAKQLGLNQVIKHRHSNENGISVLQHRKDKNNHYIPYSNRPLNWHTDGYYSDISQFVQSFILHCQCTAAEGGVNKLLDHEIAYIALRDRNPEYIQALADTVVMTIPADSESQGYFRKSSCGPVFFSSDSAKLNMRYTSRTQSIQWKSDLIVDQARAALTQILNHHELIICHKLQANEGIICNNILHARTEFHDSQDQCRRLYRVRFLDRIEIN